MELKKGITLGKEMVTALTRTNGCAVKPVQVNTNGLKYAPNSMSMRKSMTYDEAFEMIKNYKGKPFSYSDRVVKVSIDGDEYVGKWLGGGGSKCAYRVDYNGDDICLLLPHAAWGDALKEPVNTQILKQKGFITNDYCKIIPVKIGNDMLPAIVSKPYDKHTFKIFDKKNPNDCLDKYIDMQDLNEANARSFMSELINDCKLCAENKLILGGDSYNIALINGKPRLYFNDLPYNSSEMFLGANYEQTLKISLQEALSALNSSFSCEAAKLNPFVKKLDDIGFQDRFIENILLTN